MVADEPSRQQPTPGDTAERRSDVVGASEHPRADALLAQEVRVLDWLRQWLDRARAARATPVGRLLVTIVVLGWLGLVLWQWLGPGRWPGWQQFLEDFFKQ